MFKTAIKSQILIILCLAATSLLQFSMLKMLNCSKEGQFKVAVSHSIIYQTAKQSLQLQQNSTVGACWCLRSSQWDYHHHYVQPSKASYAALCIEQHWYNIMLGSPHNSLHMI